MKTKKEGEEMDMTFEIIERIAALSDQRNGWRRELNLVSWNGKEPKYDIRGWNDDHTKCTKGILLSAAELRELQYALNSLGI